MHPSKTQPCVICRELEQDALGDIGLCDACHGWDYIFIEAGIPNKTKECMPCKKYRDHKRICNVHKVWIEGRG
jgi:hypothetical protein